VQHAYGAPLAIRIVVGGLWPVNRLRGKVAGQRDQ